MSMPFLRYAGKSRCPRVMRLRQARCVFNNGSSSLDVTLRNISLTGASIVGDRLSCLPPTFEFQIHDSFGGYSGRHARLIWTRGAMAGIEFTD
jgi:hypothetical protein